MRGPKPRKNSVTFMPARLAVEEVAELVQEDHDDDAEDDHEHRRAAGDGRATASDGRRHAGEPAAPGCSASARSSARRRRRRRRRRRGRRWPGVGSVGGSRRMSVDRSRSCSITVGGRPRGPGGRRRSRVDRRRLGSSIMPVEDRVRGRRGCRPADAPVEEGGHRHLVGGVQPGRGRAARPARPRRPGRGRGRRRGRAARSRAGRSAAQSMRPNGRGDAVGAGQGVADRQAHVGHATAGRWWRRR